MITSSYLSYLPGPFRDARGEAMLGRFLLAFEHVLSGRADLAQALPPDADARLGEMARRPGLEERIAGLPSCFDPGAAPAAFLPWLAGWVGERLDPSQSEAEARAFLREATGLHRRRGTREGLRQRLALHTRRDLEIREPRAGAFEVLLPADLAEPRGAPQSAEIQRFLLRVSPLLEEHKPAETYYQLGIFQIGRRSTLGVDSLIGLEAGS